MSEMRNESLAVHHCRKPHQMSWLWVLNTKLTSCRSVSPGRRTTDGKPGWLMLSGKPCEQPSPASADECRKQGIAITSKQAFRAWNAADCTLWQQHTPGSPRPGLRASGRRCHLSRHHCRPGSCHCRTAERPGDSVGVVPPTSWLACRSSDNAPPVINVRREQGAVPGSMSGCRAMWSRQIEAFG